MASPVPAGAIVGDAVTSDGTALAGVSRRRGKLIDSDRTAGAFTGQPQPNYAAAFELTVPCPLRRIASIRRRDAARSSSIPPSTDPLSDAPRRFSGWSPPASRARPIAT